LSETAMPLEIRWFNKNNIDYDLAYIWFKSMDPIFKTECREDQYLFLPNSEDIGIKLRPWKDEEGNEKSQKFEIKWRKKRTLNFDLISNKLSGTLEEWVKWSWIFTNPPESTDNNFDFFSTLPNGPGIKIKKYRLLRSYSYQDISKSLQRINTDSGEEGIQLEITKLICNDETWWSLGFEGIGKKNNESEFSDAIKKILKDFKIILDKTDSFGYPEWIKNNFHHLS
jgi:hypothetical protein